MKTKDKYQLISVNDFLGNSVYVESKVVFYIDSTKKLSVGEVKTLGTSSILVEDFATHKENDQ